MNYTHRYEREPGFSRYAADTILPLVRTLQSELSGVRKADDTEYVHQARVASRRLRACLNIFSPCFRSKNLKKWRRAIRKITRSLGEARDLDVQIDFVHKFLTQQIEDGYSGLLFFYSPESDNQSSHGGEPHHPLFSFHKNGADANNEDISKVLISCPIPFDRKRPGLECLLYRLQEKRFSIQSDVVRTVDELDDEGILQSMTTSLHELKVIAELEDSKGDLLFSYQQACISIMAALSDLFWYEPWLCEPDMIHRHHEMRIAAKRLRYTLEAFADLFEDGLKSEIKTFKSLQDILGEMHDCDVWIERIPEYLHEEERRAAEYFGNTDFFSILACGLESLLLDRKEKREKLFSDLNVLWDMLKKQGFWDRLKEKISIPVHQSLPGSGNSCHDGPVTIACISDIHANLPALEAVLADARQKGAQAILNAGDSIGYGAFPNEVITTLRSSRVLSVIGNYDQAVLSKKWKTGRPRSRDKQIAMRFAYHHLSKENRAYLAGLPRDIRLMVRGVSILVTHGSPDSLTEYLVRETPESRFHEILQKTDADIIVTGHSHLPSIKQVEDAWFVNCGSVGRSEDGDPRACYALLTLDPLSIVHVRVPYDVSLAVDALRKRHLPDSFARIVSEGRPLDVVSEPQEQI